MATSTEEITLSVFLGSGATGGTGENVDDAFAPSSTSRDVEAIPDGGYGWIVVFACFVQTFWVNAWTGSWGILLGARPSPGNL